MQRENVPSHHSNIAPRNHSPSPHPGIAPRNHSPSPHAGIAPRNHAPSAQFTIAQRNHSPLPHPSDATLPSVGTGSFNGNAAVGTGSFTMQGRLQRKEDFDNLDTITDDTPWHKFQDPNGLLHALMNNTELQNCIHDLEKCVEECLDHVRKLRLQESTSTSSSLMGLNDDELLSIALYTFDSCSGQDVQFFYQLNRSLRQRGGRVRMLRTFGSHTYYMLQAMRKLPNVEGTVYRGLDDRALVASRFKRGSTVQFRAWTSTTTDFKTAQEFSDIGEGCILRIDIFTGKDIGALSIIETECEVLLSPNMRFFVTKGLYQDEDRWYIDLVENTGVLQA